MGITRYPAVSGSTYWAVPTAAGGGNTKGAYVELTAATSEALRGLFVMVPVASTGGANYLIDIATGAAASESVVVADIPYGSLNSNTTLNQIGVFVPVSIASGTRLSVRTQTSNGASGNTISVAVLGIGGTSSAVPTTYGTAAASSAGTTVDPGAAANTKGSYAELTAATSADMDWLIVFIQSSNASPSTGSWAFDIATGAASSEVVVAPDLSFQWNSSFDGYGPVAFSLPVSISAGTRLAARAQSTVTDATDRVFNVSVIGVTNSGMNGGGGGGTTYRPVIGGGLGHRAVGVF